MVRWSHGPLVRWSSGPPPPWFLCSLLVGGVYAPPTPTPAPPFFFFFTFSGCANPLPPLRFLTLCKIASSLIPPAQTAPIWTLSEPVIKVFANGGGSAPAQPPQLFYAMQAGFQEHRAINTNCVKHVVVTEFVKGHHTCILFANAGCISPNPRIIFQLCKIASSIILPAKTEPVWTFSAPVIKGVRKWGGLRPPPPPPPAPPAFLSHARWLSRESHNQRKLRQTHFVVFEVFKTHNRRSLFANEVPPTPRVI